MLARPAPILATCVLVATCAAAGPARRGSSDTFPRPRTEPSSSRGDDAALASYRSAQRQLDVRRAELAVRLRRAKRSADREGILREASDLANRSLVELTDSWIGTRWDFYGKSEEPGRGAIACGYFVSTLLRDLGLHVERVRLAQQASEYIVKTLSPPSRIWRFRTGSVRAVLEKVRAQPERWFVVGLDFHVGLLLRTDDGEILMCHSSYLEPQHAVCEDAETAAAMQSNYHVVGALFTPGLVEAWLAGDRLPTKTR